MKFLVDNALSPKLARILNEHGHDAMHVRDYNLAEATDEEVIARARDEWRTIITADGDFGRILALLRLTAPSVIFIREDGPHRAQPVADLLLRQLDSLSDDLRTGCLIVVHRGHIRVRPLPIVPE